MGFFLSLQLDLFDIWKKKNISFNTKIYIWFKILLREGQYKTKITANNTKMRSKKNAVQWSRKSETNLVSNEYSGTSQRREKRRGGRMPGDHERDWIACSHGHTIVCEYLHHQTQAWLGTVYGFGSKKERKKCWISDEWVDFINPWTADGSTFFPLHYSNSRLNKIK